MAQVAAEGERQFTTTKMDLDAAEAKLAGWLAPRLGSDGPPTIVGLTFPTSGMSSISLIFDAQWTVEGEARAGGFVVRLGPEPSAVPLFEEYDLRKQFELQRAVYGHPGVPVPEPLWHEPSAEVLGGEFFVMERCRGQVAGDSPPYVFDGWLHGIDEEKLRQVQSRTVDVLAAVHAIDGAALSVLDTGAGSSEEALRAHLREQRAYYEWTRREDGMRIPVLENAFDWVEANWPEEFGERVLSWGDSRLGNLMFDDDAEVVAVLDWENATLAPRELDLGWLIFFHRFFQDTAEHFGMPGLPTMFRRADVVAQYEAITGVELRNLEFFMVYAALRHGIVMSQAKRRLLHFGETEPANSPDEYVLHHRMLADLVAGTYEWDK